MKVFVAKIPEKRDRKCVGLKYAPGVVNSKPEADVAVCATRGCKAWFLKCSDLKCQCQGHTPVCPGCFDGLVSASVRAGSTQAR